MGALTELSRAPGDDSYIATAKTIADAAIAHLTNADGVLHEYCEPDCGGHGSQVSISSKLSDTADPFSGLVQGHLHSQSTYPAKGQP